MKVDLHMHSTSSDGTLTPKELVLKAKTIGLNAMALTDHDNISGLKEARNEAKKQGIKFVNGVELSTFAIGEVHILGYNFDINSDILLSSLEDFEEKRKERIKLIAERLLKFNIKVDLDELYKNKSVGRPHVANQLVKKGYVANISEAFDRYLGVHGLAYVPSKRITPLEGVKLIKEAKGLAVIAHPWRFILEGRLQDLVDGLMPYGLAGIETYYPAHDEKMIKYIKDLATKRKLIMTGGSDYHGANKNVEMGCLDFELDNFTKRKLGLL